MNKRKFNNEIIFELTKKNKIEFISSSALKNFICKDPLIDYLSYWHINDIKDKPDKNRIKIEQKSDFLNFLFKEGTIFENNIYNKIKENHNVKQVFHNISDLTLPNFELTKEYMQKGIEIIFQGVLYNFDNNTYGVADLLVRSDYINILIPDIIDPEEEKIQNKFYYFAIDIKNSTIELNKDGLYVLNSKNLPFYKIQLLLYTKAISNILNVEITKAFILGKRYHWGNSFYENDSFAKLGIIDYKNIDNLNLYIIYIIK
jgi:hypothetical protein